MRNRDARGYSNLIRFLFTVLKLDFYYFIALQLNFHGVGVFLIGFLLVLIAVQLIVIGVELNSKRISSILTEIPLALL